MQEAARAGRWKSPERPGKWVKVTRTFRDGSTEDWWALEVVTGLNAPDKPQRVVIATTDPLTLPDLTTFYLATNLPAPGSQRAADSELAAASLEEVVRLYGLRMWVEHSYKHVKHALGWSQSQVRSDKAIRHQLRLLVLLVSCQSPHCEPDRRGSRAIEARNSPPHQCSCSCSGNGEKKSAGKEEFDRRCPGQWRCGRCADGWSPGSCCGATGTAGRHCPHLLRCSSFSDGLNEDMPLLSLVLLDPKSTNYRYEVFQVAEARRLCQRFEVHYTPKHASWLNMAEIELSALDRQCLSQRLASLDMAQRQIAAWASKRNQQQVTIEWRFTAEGASIKLKHLYPSIKD